MTSAATSTPLRGHERHPGDHAMGAAREQTQHARGIGGVLRLGQDVVVERDGGVGAEHHEESPSLNLRQTCSARHVLAIHGLGLFPRQPRDVDDRVLAGQRILSNMRGMHLER